MWSGQAHTCLQQVSHLTVQIRTNIRPRAGGSRLSRNNRRKATERFLLVPLSTMASVILKRRKFGTTRRVRELAAHSTNLGLMAQWPYGRFSSVKVCRKQKKKTLRLWETRFSGLMKARLKCLAWFSSVVFGEDQTRRWMDGSFSHLYRISAAQPEWPSGSSSPQFDSLSKVLLALNFLHERTVELLCCTYNTLQTMFHISTAGLQSRSQRSAGETCLNVTLHFVPSGRFAITS